MGNWLVIRVADALAIPFAYRVCIRIGFSAGAKNPSGCALCHAAGGFGEIDFTADARAANQPVWWLFQPLAAHVTVPQTFTITYDIVIFGSLFAIRPNFSPVAAPGEVIFLSPVRNVVLTVASYAKGQGSSIFLTWCQKF